MDGAVVFSTSYRSRSNPPWSSDCRLVMLHKGVKEPWTECFPAESSTFLLVTQQPMELWLNGSYGWIQFVK